MGIASGQRLGGYLIEAELGRGGMGTVYRAVQTSLNRPVALKVMHAELAADADFVARFHREASILATLDSPHIIQLFDHGELDGRLYLAMQFVTGGDLNHLIHGTGPLRPRTALEIFCQIVSACGDAHARGVVHRDVKPSNVLLRAEGSEPFAYLCDFGIAQAGPSGLTRYGTVAGSWAYLSPERQSGGPATPASDLYSAACVLWFMLTGRGVYTGTDVELAIAHREAAIPQLRGFDPLIVELNRLFTACLAKDPAARPPDAAAALELARRCLPAAYGAIPLDLNSPDSGIFRTARRPDSPAPLSYDPTPEPGSWPALASATPPAAPPPPAPRRRTVKVAAVAAAVVGAAAITAAALTLGLGSLFQTLSAPSGVTSQAPSSPAAAPAPTPGVGKSGFLCWDGTAARQLADCGRPSGKAGLWYVYPSLRDNITECEYVAYRDTTDTYDCVVDTFGLIRYRYWSDVAEADRHYTEKYADATETDLVLDGEVVGSLFRSAGKIDGVYVMSGHWLDGHFSFSVEARTKAQREELFRMLAIRAYEQLPGLPTDAPVRIGRIG